MEPAPSCLRGTTHILDLVTLGPDQCSMTYKGQGHHSPDVAAVQVGQQLHWPCLIDHAALCCMPLHHASATACYACVESHASSGCTTTGHLYRSRLWHCRQTCLSPSDGVYTTLS